MLYQRENRQGNLKYKDVQQDAMLDAKQERPTEQWYEIISRSLIENTELQPLSKFKYTKASKILYPDAHSYPDFFAHNLVSPGRVIKHIRGKSALLKAFYYQFMKLAFEIEVLDRDYIEIFKSIIFHPNIRVENQFTSPTSGRGHSDQQYKRFIAEFMDIMAEQGIPNFELQVMEYPVVDEALMHTFQNLMAVQYVKDKREGTQEEMLGWLADLFQENVVAFNRCYKFEESDIFLYREGENDYYVAFLNQMAEVSDYNSDSKKDYEEEAERIKRRDMLNYTSQREQDQQDIIASNKYRNSAKIVRAEEVPAPRLRQTLDPQPLPIEPAQTTTNSKMWKDNANINVHQQLESHIAKQLFAEQSKISAALPINSIKHMESPICQLLSEKNIKHNDYEQEQLDDRKLKDLTTGKTKIVPQSPKGGKSGLKTVSQDEEKKKVQRTSNDPYLLNYQTKQYGSPRRKHEVQTTKHQVEEVQYLSKYTYIESQHTSYSSKLANEVRSKVVKEDQNWKANTKDLQKKLQDLSQNLTLDPNSTFSFNNYEEEINKSEEFIRKLELEDTKRESKRTEAKLGLSAGLARDVGSSKIEQDWTRAEEERRRYAQERIRSEQDRLRAEQERQLAEHQSWLREDEQKSRKHPRNQQKDLQRLIQNIKNVGHKGERSRQYDQKQININFQVTPVKDQSRAGRKEYPHTIGSEEELFYRPPTIINPAVSELIDYTQQPVQNTQDQAEQSEGTLYRQFTNTNVLRSVREVQRMRINQIRSKFKKMHKRDIYKLAE